ncbi:MAG: hypothetical protein ABWY93_19725 [Mycobacterium sp.]
MTPSESNRPVNPALIALAWLWVSVPMVYAIWQLLTKIAQLFGT